MKSLLLVPFFALLLICESTWASQAGVLEISPSHKVFYKYQKPKPGRQTIVLINGLIYAIESWDEYFDELKKDGVGILQIAYSTQPESLALLNHKTPYFAKVVPTVFGPNQKGLETQDLVDEVMAVVDSKKIKNFTLLSLSYGSIVASQLAVEHRDRIDQLILVSPAVVTSGRYNAYGLSRHLYYAGLKAAGNPAADHFYDLEIFDTLATLVTAQKYHFDNVAFFDFFSGVYQMARSSKWFDLKDYASQPLPETYLFLASREDPPLHKDQLKFWQLMEVNPAKKALVHFKGSFHAIPGVAPVAAAEQTLKVIHGQMKPGETTVKVGTGNPIGTLKNTLTDWGSLTDKGGD